MLFVLFVLFIYLPAATFWERYTGNRDYRKSVEEKGKRGY